jgi:polar amino acid transport system substrate-binding protein
MWNYKDYEILGMLVFLTGSLAYFLIRYFFLRRNVYFNKELFKALFLHLKEDIVFVDKEGTIIFSNKEAQDILTLEDPNKVDDQKLTFRVKDYYSGQEIFMEELLKLRAEVSFKGYLTEGETGIKHLIVGTVVPTFFPKKQYRGSAIVLRDITQEKRTEEIIYNVINYDRVTGIPNKNYFEDYLNLSIQSAKIENKMMALFFIDLDNFKTVNDIMGHTMGDILLKNVATAMKELMDHGSQIARIGGDEFTLVMPSVDRFNDILVLSRKLMNLFKQTWELGDKAHPITVSMGIAVYPNDGSDAESLMRNADTALNNAKEEGKNTYKFYTRAMNTSIKERFDVENNLRYAVERDQFVIHYQPIVDAKKLEITSCEALVRWVHPINGLVLPLHFISVAEETGLINALGEIVLRKACLQHHAWMKEGLPPIKVAVNFSAKQFKDSNLLEMIKRVVKETNMNTKYLEVEITESFAMHNIEYVIYTLNEIKKMGIGIAVDDFGTGYSSVKYLKLLPIDVLKIDKSFIDELEGSNAQREIVKALISLAHGIHLKVTAEGVESIEQLKFLGTHQCDKIQGYIFSKPVPPDQFSELYLNEWQRTVNQILSLR